MIRYALITSTWDRDNPAAYMPANYEVVYSEPHPDRGEHSRTQWTQHVIAGRDSHGWTLDGYVLPRLASGGMYGQEIDLSHEVMKRVPDTH
jgi:hypothetical protein